MFVANHTIAHVEIPATNNSEAGKFYNDVFGWRIETNQAYNYVTFEAKNGLRGGFVEPAEITYQQGRLLVYLTTDDIDATLAVIEAHGGKTVHPKTEFPRGWWAVFTDPTGNQLGLVEPAHQG